MLLRVQLYHGFYRLTTFLLDKTSSSIGHHRYKMVPVVAFFVYSYFVVNIWSRNFTFLSVGNRESVCSWFFLNISNSRFLNSFRVAFNVFYPLAILNQFFKGQTVFVLLFSWHTASDFSVFCRTCAKIRHLKSSAVKSANLKSLQCLTVAANDSYCWSALNILRHFHLMKKWCARPK